MKKQLLELGICAAFTLSFLGILVTANDESPVARQQVAIENTDLPEGVPGGSQGGAPTKEENGSARVSDNQRKEFSACVLGPDSKLFLSLESGSKGNVVFEVYDASGKLVFEFPDQAIPGQNIYQISMKYAVPGVYFIKATLEGYSRVAKVSKVGTTA